MKDAQNISSSVDKWVTESKQPTVYLIGFKSLPTAPFKGILDSIVFLEATNKLGH